ncbi:MAG: RHS repeat protein [Candidatus Aureabacteria bacterium]|nr:RHS repeat protein [Candidatus Auribacterota bacterium]
MRRKRILIFSILVLICSATVFAQAYSSTNYTLTNPRLVSSGGKAASSNYSLKDVQVGNPITGTAGSENFTLEAYPLYKVVYSEFCPTEVFEDFDGEDKRIDYWWNGYDGDEVYTRSLDNTIFRTGSTSMKVEYNKSGHPLSLFAVQLKYNGVDNDFSEYDKLSFWIYTDNPQLTIRIKFEDGNGNAWEGDCSSNVQGDWQRFVYDFSDAHEYMDLSNISWNVLFFVDPGQADTQGIFYMDDIALHSSRSYFYPPLAEPILSGPEEPAYGEYQINWTAIPGAAIYELLESNNPAFENAAVYWTNNIYRDFKNRITPTTYYYKLRAWSNVPEEGGTSGDWSDTISVEVIDGYPVIEEVYSLYAHINPDGSYVHSVGDYVKVALKEKYNAPDIVSGTFRVTSQSQGYDSGIVEVTKSEDGLYCFYHWDTNGLNPADDYVVAATLTDAIGQTDTDGSDQDPDLTIFLILAVPSRHGTNLETDFSISSIGIPLKFERFYHSGMLYDGPIGDRWTHNYNMQIEEQEDGNVTLLWKIEDYWNFFTKNPDGSYKSSGGKNYILAKNPDNTFTLKMKDNITYKFNLDNKLSAIEDLNGNQITLSYTDGLLITITDTSGRQLNFFYNENNKIEHIIDFADRLFTHEYDSIGNLIKYIDPLGYETTYEYDGHNLTVITNSRGYHTYFSYIDDKLLSKSNDNGINHTTYSSLTEPNRMIITNARGYETTYITEDTTHSSIVDALGNITTTVSNDQHKPLSVTDANENTWSYTWDEKGNLLTETDPDNNTTTYTHKPDFNLITSRTNAKDITITYNYDGNGNLTDISNPPTHFTYDEYGQLISITDTEENNTTTLSYDDYGNMTILTDAENNTITIAYNILGKPITATDAEGNITLYTYDILGNLIEATDALNNITQYEYNENNNLAMITDANGNVAVAYAYDEVDRLITIIEQGKTTRYDYDLIGNLTIRTDANNDITTYAYNEVNRLTKRTYPDTTEVGFTHDPVGNRLTMTSVSANIQWTYDKLNRITQLLNLDLNKSISYTYDEIGNRTTMIDPDGGITNYIYDNLNRLTSLTNPQSQTTQFSCNNLDLPKTITYPNNAEAVYTYDKAKKLISLVNKKEDNSIISFYTYTYDKVGNRTSMTDHNGDVEIYIYDNLYRLIQVTYPNSEIVNYTYDPVGNRLSMTNSLDTVNYNYNITNRLTSEISSSKSIFYSYDDNGNLIQKNDGAIITGYTYDYENRLVLVDDGISMVGYTYSPLGERLSKTINGITTYFFYDGKNILMEYDASYNVMKKYTTSLEIDEIISIDQ